MIHSTAIIASCVQLGANVQVGAYSVLEGEVIVGDGTIIDHHCCIKGPVLLGKNNKIGSFSYIGCDPQDKKYQGEESFLEIGDRNIIHQSVTISRGTADGGFFTRIGSDNIFMAYVHVAHDCQLGDFNILANNASLAGHVQVGNYVGLGGFCGVHQFCRIGSHAFCAGGSLITKDVSPFTLVAGQPAKLNGLNLEGLKRRGFSQDKRNRLKQLYKTLFRSSTNIIEDTEKLLLQEYDEHAQVLLNFVLTSERGLIR